MHSKAVRKPLVAIILSILHVLQQNDQNLALANKKKVTASPPVDLSLHKNTQILSTTSFCLFLRGDRVLGHVNAECAKIVAHVLCGTGYRT